MRWELAVLEHDEAGWSHINVNGVTVASTYASEASLLCLFDGGVPLWQISGAVVEVLTVLCAADYAVPADRPEARDDVEWLVSGDVAEILEALNELRVRMRDGSVGAVELVAREVL